MQHILHVFLASSALIRDVIRTMELTRAPRVSYNMKQQLHRGGE